MESTTSKSGITVKQTRFGTFAAFGPSESWGILAVAETADAARMAGEFEFLRRSKGHSSLESVRAEGRRVALFAEARKSLSSF